MKGTRHSGRSGANGVYNPKHNDREFDLDNAEDINSEMTPNNIYWNFYQGFTFHRDRGDDWMPFKDVELKFYKDNFQNGLMPRMRDTSKADTESGSSPWKR